MNNGKKNILHLVMLNCNTIDRLWRKIYNRPLHKQGSEKLRSRVLTERYVNRMKQTTSQRDSSAAMICDVLCCAMFLVCIS